MLQLPFQLFRRQRGYERMNCLNCQDETLNPKFCSRSCAATYNNKRNPKRKPEGTCKDCGKPNTRSRTYCKDCWPQHASRDWSKVTLEQLKGEGNANFHGRYPMIRALSRKAYINSNQPMKCKVCSYDLHVDICHIKDIKSFPSSASIADINNVDNLVALCKNHHWEFDNGHRNL